MIRDRWGSAVTAVANEFIDGYMAAANGEYVKVYLYILRHQGEAWSVEAAADALNNTESDVRRALGYWKKLGVLKEEEEAEAEEEGPAQAEETAAPKASFSLEKEPGGTVSFEVQPPQPAYSAEQVNRLAGDEEFSQLLYIAQKYMDRVFTPRDCQVFAYLYDGLGMKGELLEYLVEYCAQNGHTSVRYLETVALSWHQRGIRTAEEARTFCASRSRDSFAVMKAFGLGGRAPAAAEQQLIDKWFKEYGFARELVLEACARTISAIHNPSFQYADRILSDWKKEGVRTPADLAARDARRGAGRSAAKEEQQRRMRSYSTAPAVQGSRSGAPNRFHNFKQRDNVDYDALVLQQVKELIGEEEPRGSGQ